MLIPEGWTQITGDQYLKTGDRFYDTTIMKWKPSRAAFYRSNIKASDYPTIIYIRKKEVQPEVKPEVQPQFNVGDVVTIKDFYSGKLTYLNNIKRKIVNIKKSRTSASGKMVALDGPNAHTHLNRQGITIDSGYLIKEQQNAN